VLFLLPPKFEGEGEAKDVGLVATVFEPEPGYIANFNGRNVKLQTDFGVDKTLNPYKIHPLQGDGVQRTIRSGGEAWHRRIDVGHTSGRDD